MSYATILEAPNNRIKKLPKVVSSNFSCTRSRTDSALQSLKAVTAYYTINFTVASDDLAFGICRAELFLIDYIQIFYTH